MLSSFEQMQIDIARATDPDHKSRLGQYFTPASIAKFMVALFGDSPFHECRLLDAGAGVGSLSTAFVEGWISGELNFARVEVDAYELDERLHPHLRQELTKHSKNAQLQVKIQPGDFVHIAADHLSGNLYAEALPQYTHAILNPPYKKIRTDSAYRAALSRAGIETVNLYSAFVALALLLLKDQGQLVAIIPRSFCNGPYYRPFRQLLFKHSAIRHIHLFVSRNKAFSTDNVLQENIILMLERGGVQGDVTVTRSTDETFSDLDSYVYPFNRVVLPEDLENFIHIPMSPTQTLVEQATTICYTLDDLGIEVSTGPVVDFRLQKHLRDLPEKDTVPLLYPGHFRGRTSLWPNPTLKKPNAIVLNSETQKWLFPNGYYCVVRRFSSKEEKRRIVATVVEPHNFPKADYLGFENHLNIFHRNKSGIDIPVVHGLAAFLNSTAVDEYFRRFNGHTQVNATDLRLLKYPSREILTQLGEQMMLDPERSQQALDKEIERLIPA